MTSSGLQNATQRRDGSRYASATDPFFVCLSCSLYISSSSFVVVASSDPLSSRQRPVNRGNRIARCDHNEGAARDVQAAAQADEERVGCTSVARTVPTLRSVLQSARCHQCG